MTTETHNMTYIILIEIIIISPGTTIVFTTTVFDA